MTAPNPDDRPETMLRRIDFDTSPEPVTNADEFDTDKLPVQQYLVLEVLAARYRTGEVTWTFPTRVRWALLHLAELGLIGYKSGVAPRTYLAWLTEAGKSSAMSETYEPPVGRLVPPDADTRTQWAVRKSSVPDGEGVGLPSNSREKAEFDRDRWLSHDRGYPVTAELVQREVHNWPDGSCRVGPWVPVPTGEQAERDVRYAPGESGSQPTDDLRKHLGESTASNPPVPTAKETP